MIYLRFYEELNDFLPAQQRKRDLKLEHTFSRSVKDLIESRGVPHVEVDLILVNSESVDFAYAVRDGDRISVYPVFERLDIQGLTRLRPRALRDPRFIADVHLKTPARKLRMLGFDTLYDPAWDDPQLAGISNREERILLTRDIGLLKRSIVSRGLFIRSNEPAGQIGEIIRRLDLVKRIDPLTRCIRCNRNLEKIDVHRCTENAAEVPVDILESHQKLSYCPACRKFYWRGSHYDTMIRQIEKLTKDP